MTTTMITPERHFIQRNKCAPNSSFPILIYRNALPQPVTEDSCTEYLERSGAWQKRGTWGHISYRHFHPNTHEAYGVFQGESVMLLGQGASDQNGGIEVHLKVGDVIVLPAGTAHCCLKSSDDYRYIGIYPTQCPKWRNGYGKQPLELNEYHDEINAVAFPEQDPVNAQEGPLPEIWKAIKA